MTPILQDIVNKIRKEAEGGDIVSMTTRLQQELNNRGMRYAFTDEELREALTELGVSGDEQDNWFEEMASWL